MDTIKSSIKSEIESINIPLTTESIWIPNQLDTIRDTDTIHGRASIKSSSYASGAKGTDWRLVTQANDTTETILASLFRQFFNLVDTCLSLIEGMPLSSSFHLKDCLPTDTMTKVDQAMIALGSIGRHNQKLWFQTLLTWHGLKMEQVSDTPFKKNSQINSVNNRKQWFILYLIYRCLQELVKQIKLTRSSGYKGDEEDFLEAFIFKELLSFTPQVIMKSANHVAIYSLLADLIECLSAVKFMSLSDAFIAYLEKIPSDNSHPDFNEQQSIMTIYSMRYLKLKIYPDDALEETSEFLLSCASFFKQIHITSLKNAYVEAFIELLLPVAPMVHAEVNFPSWAQAIDVIYQKAYKMGYKTRYHPIAFPLISILLCVSTKESFQTKWMPMVEQCLAKLKDKQSRQYAIGCISRILWVYLNRCPDSNSQLVEKKLDAIFKIIFPPLKRSTYLIESGLDHYALIVYFTTSWNFEYGCRDWISSLLNADVGSNVNWLDSLLLERFVVVMKACIFLMIDTHRSEKTPIFPYLSDFGLPNPLDINPKTYPQSLDAKVNWSETKMNPIINNLINILSHVIPQIDANNSTFMTNDEKYLTPKPSMAQSNISETFSFAHSTRDVLPDNTVRSYPNLTTLFVSYPQERQVQFDLLRTWLNTLPHLIPPPYTMTKVAELCVKYLIHVDPQVSKAAAAALTRIAGHYNLHVFILKAMLKLIHRIDPHFSEVLASINTSKASSDNGLEVLQIVVCILDSWYADLIDETKNADEIDTSNAWTLIEDLEATSLLLLCSTLSSIRQFAIKILKISSQIEQRLESLVYHQTEPASPSRTLPGRVHIAQILESEEAIAIAKRFTSKNLTSSSLERLTDLSHVTLVESATSHNATLISIWQQAFPHVISHIHSKCPIATVLCRHYVYNKLASHHSQIKSICDEPSVGDALGITVQTQSNASGITAKDIFVEQWGQYLCFASVTTNTVNDHMPVPSYAKRKGSIADGDHINSAKDLFRMVFVLLSCENKKIRQLVIHAMSHVNAQVYGAFLDNLQPFVRIVQADSVNFAQTRKRNKQNRFRKAIAKCLRATAHLLEAVDPLLPSHLDVLMVFLEDVFSFLSLSETQNDWIYQPLRIDFFGFVEQTYSALGHKGIRDAHFSFDLRVRLFSMAEQWCGHGQYASSTRDRELRMMGQVLSQYTNIIERGAKTSEMENERKSAELQALSLMATLCDGSLIGRVTTASQSAPMPPHSFDLGSIFRWIESVFNSPDKRVHFIPKKALDALLASNTDHPLLFENILHNCYGGDLHTKATREYFLSLADVLSSNKYSYTLGKQLFLLVFKAGDPSLEIRMAACKVLEAYWAQNQSQDKDNALDRKYLMSLISNPLTSVYEQAQFDLSVELASANSSLAQEVLSEVIMRFSYLGDESKRKVINCLSTWVGELTLETELDSENLTFTSIGILKNLFYMVVKFADTYPIEVENLCKSILNNTNNNRFIKHIVDFFLSIAIEKRNSSLIIHAKKFFVYSLNTINQAQIVNYLLLLMCPSNMIPKKSVGPIVPDAYSQFGGNLYVVDLDEVLITSHKNPPLSIGQLALVFLSDLIFENMEVLAPNISLIVHLSLSLVWNPVQLPDIIVQQAKYALHNILMAVNLKLEHDLPVNVEPIIDRIEQTKTVCNMSESDLDAKHYETVNLIVQTLNPLFPELIYQWIQIATFWSTNCPVRSISTISLKILKFLGLPINIPILKVILMRLSNSLYDHNFGIQVFCKELLITLKDCLQYSNDSLKELTPLLFWFTVTCLQTSNESEYLVLMDILEFLILEADVKSLIQFNVTHFKDNARFPIPQIEEVVIRGLSSHLTAPACLRVLDLLFQDGMHKLFRHIHRPCLMILLYHIVYILKIAFDDPSSPEVTQEIDNSELIQWLIHLTEITEQSQLTQFLISINKKKLRGETFFIRELVQLIKDGHLDRFEREAIALILGLLASPDRSSQMRYLKVLKLFTTLVNPDIFRFVDPTSPLLRPLIQLLDTDMREDALEVIEDIISYSPSNSSVPISGLIQYQDPADDSTKFDSDALHPLNSNYLNPSTSTLENQESHTGWTVEFNPDEQQTMRNCLIAIVQKYLSTEEKPDEDDTSEPKDHYFLPNTDYDLNIDHLPMTTEFLDDRASSHYNPSIHDTAEPTWLPPADYHVDEVISQMDQLNTFFQHELNLY